MLTLETTSPGITETTLIEDRQADAEKQLRALQDRRRWIAACLEAYRDALENLLGEAPTLDEVLDWLQPEDLAENVPAEFLLDGRLIFRRYDIPLQKFQALKAKSMDSLGQLMEARALRRWLEVHHPNLPAHLVPLRQAEEKLPDEVRNFVECWKNAAGVSSDPERYWSAARQAFKELAVSKEEKEAVEERNRFYATRDEQVYALQAGRALAAFFSMLNQWNISITPARLKNLFGDPAVVEKFFKYRRLEKLPAGVTTRECFVYEFNDRAVVTHSGMAPLFDELLED